jgi:hypothetical protein
LRPTSVGKLGIVSSAKPSLAPVLYRIIAISKWLFTPIALAALVWFAWSAREVLAGIFSAADIGRLGSCVVLWSVGQALVPTFLYWTLRRVDVDIEWSTLLSSHFRRLPARYLPGGIWHTVGRAVDMGRAGIAPRRVAAVLALEQFGALLVTVTVGGFITAVYATDSHWHWSALIGAFAGILGFPLLWRFVNVRVLKHKPGIGLGGFCGGLVIVSAFWLIAACAFLLYLSALTLPGVPDLLGSLGDAVRIAGVYLFSWAVGFIAVFAPQGIGVLELVAADLLGATVPLAQVAIIIAGFRGVVLISDVLLWLMTEFVRRAVAR